MKTCSILRTAALATGLLAAMAAEANGINPPRPRESEIVVARCTPRKAGEVIVVQRARIRVGDTVSEQLEVRLGKAPVQTVALAKVAGIELASAKTRAEGFAVAKLALREPAFQGAGSVRLKTGAKPVRLVGFDGSLAPVDMPLADCKAFEAGVI